jgi:purine catabolism regulator
VQTYKDDFLKDILLGEAIEEEEVIASARKFGWDLTKEFQVFVVSFDNSAFFHNDDNDTVLLQRFKMSLLQRMTDILSFVNKPTIVGLRKDTLVVLYPVDAIDDFQESCSKKKSVPIAEQILKQLNQSFDDNCFTIGMGRFHKGIRGIQSAYSEAANAAQLGMAVWGKGKCIHFDDLGIYRILGQFHDGKELESLYAESIGKIVDFDRNNQSRLLETLSEYFHNNYVLTETAERLFIHINTLKYRLQNIELLTGCSISNAEERLRLHIGLKIQDILNNPI